MRECHVLSCLDTILCRDAQVLNLENWQDAFYGAVRAVGWGWPLVYFVSWIIFGQYILLSLFLAIVMSKFEEKNREAVLQKQKAELEKSLAPRTDDSISFQSKRSTTGRAGDLNVLKRNARSHVNLKAEANSDDARSRRRTASLEDLMEVERPRCIERLRQQLNGRAFSATILVFILLSCIELGFESPSNLAVPVCFLSTCSRCITFSCSHFHAAWLPGV